MSERFAIVPECVLAQFRLRNITPADVIVFNAMALFRSSESGDAWPGQDQIAELTGFTHGAVRNSICRLRSAHLIADRAGGFRGMKAVYSLVDKSGKLHGKGSSGNDSVGVKASSSNDSLGLMGNQRMRKGHCTVQKGSSHNDSKQDNEQTKNKKVAEWHSTLADSTVDRAKKYDRSLEFQAWYESYPRKVKPDDAAKAFSKAVGKVQKRFDGDKLKSILFLIDRAETSSRSNKANGKYCPHPATWLNSADYDTDPMEWGATIPSMREQHDEGDDV